MQSSQPQTTNILDRNSLNYKSVVKSLQMVIRSEVDQQKKKQCMKILQKFVQTANSMYLKQLDSQNHKRIVQARTQLKFFRTAFEKITQSVQQYKQFKLPAPGIIDHLMLLQQKIDAKDFRASYLRALSIKKKEFGWTKQLIQDWIKAVDQQKRLHQQLTKKNIQQKNNLLKSQSIAPISQSNVSLASSIQSNAVPPHQGNMQGQQPFSGPKLQQKKLSLKTGQKSTEKIQGQKPEKKIKKDETGQKVQKQKKFKSKKQADDSDSSQNDQKQKNLKKKQQKQAKQKLDRYQKPKQPKNRVKILMQYLVSRKQFPSLSTQPQKLKQIAQYINQNLEKFMKHHLGNLIDIAKLRNKKNTLMPSAGNQFTYFSKDGFNINKPSSQLQVAQDGVKMVKVAYKPKLQLYSLLRVRQQMLEQSLLKMYISKKDSQNSKNSDKKLWQYLLRPSQVVQKAQNYIQPQQRPSERLSIQLNHIRYLFQTHKYIKNSWLMMFCYNS